MTTFIPRYPLDLSGRSPTNLIPGERKILMSRGTTPYKVVSFNDGGFYASTVKVYDKDYNRLSEGTDYILTYTYPQATEHTGLEVLGAVVILKTSLTDHVFISANIVGSDIAFDLQVEEKTIAYLNTLGNRVPIRAGLVGTPPVWEPGQLQEERWEKHHVGNLIAAIERLNTDLMNGDGVSEEATRQAIRRRYQEFVDSIRGGFEAHIQDRNEPHELTKALIGLPDVQNYPMATDAIVNSGGSNLHYMSPRDVHRMINNIAVPELNTHLNLGSAAHGITASQLNVYTTTEENNILDRYYGVNDTVANSNGIYVGNNLYYQDQFYSWLKNSLPASAFTTGRIPVANLGSGNPNSDMFLSAAGTWASLYNLIDTLIRDSYNALHQVTTTFSNEDEAIAHIRQTFSNVNAYPVGTVVIFTADYVDRHKSWNNGSSGWMTHARRRIAIRGAGGWYVHY